MGVGDDSDEPVTSTAAVVIADELDHALKSGVAAVPRRGLALVDGYAVQDAWAEGRVRQGEHRVGYKIGLTTPAARRPWGAAAPGRGVLFDSTCLRSPARVPGLGVALSYEVELAVELGEQVDADDDVAEVTRKIRAIGPAFELVGSRWQDGAPDLGAWAADNGMAAAFVLPERMTRRELPDVLDVTCELVVDNTSEQQQARTSIKEVLAAVIWLAGEQHEHHGVSLDAGTLILTGSIIGPIPIPPGGVWVRAAVDGFAPIEFSSDTGM